MKMPSTGMTGFRGDRDNVSAEKGGLYLGTSLKVVYCDKSST